MNYILLAFLFIAQTFASDQCQPNQQNIKICLEFKENILKKAVFEEANVPEDEFPYRFEKDERKAVEFLKAYDVTKLALKEQKCLYDNLRRTCANLESIRGPTGCETPFDVLNYFRGLFRGMKLNSWSKKTIALGEDVTRKHVDTILTAEPNLLDTLIAFNIVHTAQEYGFLKDSYKDIQKFHKEGEQISTSLSEEIKKKNLSCEQKLAIHQKEVERTAMLIKQWQLAQGKK